MSTIAPDLIRTLIAMAGFAFATSASPGPVNIVSAMSGEKFGARRTIPYVLGATIGFVTILGITGSGLSPIITRFPNIEGALAILGSIYMLYLAYKLSRASMNDVGGFAGQSPPNLVTGIVAQYTNPKAWIVAISAISIYVATSPNYQTTLTLFCITFFLICFPSLLGWSIIGASFAKKIGGVNVFNKLMAILLTASIVALMFEFFQ